MATSRRAGTAGGADGLLIARAIAMESLQRFRLRGSGELKLCAFDDAVVAFNPVTWETHLLDASAVVVLEALARSPANAVAIEHLLSGDGDVTSVDAPQRTTALLDQLVAAELIEPEPVDAPR